MDLLIKGLKWHNGTEVVSGDVQISKDIITNIGLDLTAKKKDKVLIFNDHFVYPGLINSHDHLEMNLYPRLGAPPYKNYVEWAKDIFDPKNELIAKIESINIKDRLTWGGLKNLVSGVTTVIHHNPWHKLLDKKYFPVKVYKNISWAHSLAFKKGVEKKFLKKNNIPFVIHAAEGVDEFAAAEIEKLHNLNLLNPNTVLVHGVAITEAGFEILKKHKVALVWCPASNLFMFNKTASIHKFKDTLKVSLGSDSTMTGSSTLLKEMQIALDTKLATTQEIFGMVTNVASDIFQLPQPGIMPFHLADLFVTPIIHKDYFENLIKLNVKAIRLVVVNGNIRLGDANIEGLVKELPYAIHIEGSHKLTDIDVASLKNRITKKVGEGTLGASALWKLIQA